jgi:crossover junction endodeoxyribonuclease RusA
VNTLTVFVPGRPAPQGSKRHVGNGVMVEMSKHVKPWRADIREHVLSQLLGTPPIDGAVQIELEFVLPRPVSTPKRSTPPAIKRPDLDKLERAVLDALSSAGVWHDDSQVTRMSSGKRIAEIGERTGCRITVAPDRTAGRLTQLAATALHLINENHAALPPSVHAQPRKEPPR